MFLSAKPLCPGLPGSTGFIDPTAISKHWAAEPFRFEDAFGTVALFQVKQPLFEPDNGKGGDGGKETDDGDHEPSSSTVESVLDSAS